ncbi:MAG: hypothetical protein ACPGUD_12550 [Parashewanella sp.]
MAVGPHSPYFLRDIEQSYYHSIVERGSEATHGSLTICGINYSASPTSGSSNLSVLIEGFLTPSNLFHRVFYSQRVRRYHTSNANVIALKYSKVINSPVVRAFAESFNEFHQRNTGSSRHANLREMHTIITDVIPYSSLSTQCCVMDMVAAYLRSIRIRGRLNTNEFFMINSSRMRLVSQQNGRFSLQALTPVALNDAFRKWDEEAFECCINSQDIQETIRHLDLEQRQRFLHERTMEIERVLSEEYVVIPSDDSVENLMASSNNGRERPLIESDLVSRSEITRSINSSEQTDEIGEIVEQGPLPSVLSRYFTISMPDIDEFSAQKVTLPFIIYLLIVINIKNDYPKTTLAIIHQLKFHITVREYHESGLYNIEQEIRTLVPEDLTSYIESLKGTHWAELPEKSTCAIGFAEFDDEFEGADEVIEMTKSGTSPEWLFVTKVNAIKLFTVADHSRHPLDRSVLTRNSFREVSEKSKRLGEEVTKKNSNSTNP